jgi:hypothetical protein
MVTFSRIYKTEKLVDGRLQWDYRAYSTINGKLRGWVSGSSEQECQEKIDYAIANPSEYISKQMSSGNL